MNKYVGTMAASKETTQHQSFVVPRSIRKALPSIRSRSYVNDTHYDIAITFTLLHDYNYRGVSEHDENLYFHALSLFI